MRSMELINRLADEKYWCPHCEEHRDEGEVKRTWRCPQCDELIVVHAISNDGKEHIAIVRKRAAELRIGDSYLLPYRLDADSHRVLGVTHQGNKLAIGLAGYGQVKLDLDEPVNCRIGCWR